MTHQAVLNNREAEEAAETIDTIVGEAPWRITWTTAPHGSWARSHDLSDEARGAAYRLAWEVELARQWDVAQCSSRLDWRELSAAKSEREGTESEPPDQADEGSD